MRAQLQPPSSRSRKAGPQHASSLLRVSAWRPVSSAASSRERIRVQASRNIVLAIDTDQGRKALQYTLAHIYRPGDTIHLLHVVPAAAGLQATQGQCLATSLPPDDELQQTMADNARRYFEEHYCAVAQRSGANVTLDLLHGNCRQTITSTICQKVEDLAAELVVLTVQRKRSFFEDLFQTPVGKQLAEVCPCPTLIIPDAFC